MINMHPLLYILAYLLLGAVFLGVYRATPWGRNPTPQDLPDAIVVVIWIFLFIIFLFWILFVFIPRCVTGFCQWLVRDDRKPKAKVTPLADDEVQKVLLGELTKKKKS